MHWISELHWAIELQVMYQRWCRMQHLDQILPADEEYFRGTWVRMCMRLGDTLVHRIKGSQVSNARIVDG